MSDLNYKVNATVTGAEDVEDLADNLERIDDASPVVDASGITDTSEALAAIEDSNAQETLENVGTAAGTADTPVRGLGASFKDMVAAIGLANIAGEAMDFVMGQIKNRLDFIAATEAWDAARVQAYGDALSEVSSDVEAIADVIRQLSDEPIIDVTGLFGLGGGTEIPNIGAALGSFGITAEEVLSVIRGGEPELDAFNQRLEEVGATGTFGSQVMGVLAGEQEAAATAAATHAAENVFYAQSQESANRALQEFLVQRDPMSQFDSEWSLLMESISDGSLDTTAAAGALNTLTSELGLTTDQVLELAQAEIDRVLEEAAAGAQAFADAASSIEFESADIVGATNAMSEFTTQLFEAGNEAQAEEAAFAALRATVADAAFTADIHTEAGRAQQDALEGVARVIDDDLSRAYENANGSQAAYTEDATRLAEQVLTRLQTELGLTDEQLAIVAEQMGLTPEQIQTRFELAGIEEARIQLQLLQGAIEGLPPEIEFQVNTLIAEGDLVGARDTVAAYYADPANQPTTTVHAEADTSDADSDLTDFADEDRHATVVADADTVTAAADTDAFVGQERLAHVSILVDNFAAARDTIDLAAADRTTTVDIETGTVTVPSATDIRNLIGPVIIQAHVQVSASNVSNRFGSRAV